MKLISCVALAGMLCALFAPAMHASAITPASCGRRVLYDGTLGTLPSAQALAHVAVGAGATQTLTQTGALLDTMAASSIYAGYGLKDVNPPTLDRTAGYTITFEVAVLNEAHNSGNRAGYSVIVLSSDTRGIELGFWQNSIWVQNGPPNLFTRAESVAVDTTISRRYALAIKGDQYTLQLDDMILLTGPLRDYTSFAGPIDPYETPNFLFFGDDTTAARARINLSFVSVSFKPCTAQLPITTRTP